MATLKDYLISGKFTGDISVNGFHMSLKDMLISAKLSGGGGPAPEQKKYIVCTATSDPGTGQTADFITLPLNRNQNPRIVMDVVITEKTNSTYRYVIAWGNLSLQRSLSLSNPTRAYMYRGAWNYAEIVHDATAFTGVEIDFARKYVSMKQADGTIKAVDDSSNNWNSVDGAFKLPLNSEASVETGIGTLYAHRITAYDSSENIICDCIAGLDGDGKACMIDQVTGNCYYDDAGEAYLVTLE